MTRPTRLDLSGEMIVARAVALRDALLQALDRGRDVEVNLAQVTDIDTTGIQLMIAAKLEAAARGRALHFVEHSQAVLDGLELLDLAAWFGDPVLLQAGRDRGRR